MPAAPATVVGIDVAKATLDLACRIKAEKYRTRGKIPNTPAGFKTILTWLTKHATADALVVMEATNVYHEAIATCLHQHGYRVCVVNPRQVAAYGQSELSRVKTDRTDAKLLVRFGISHADRLTPWQPPTPAQRKLVALTRRLNNLKVMQQMEHNRLQTADAAVRESIRTVIDQLQQQIKAVEAALKQHVDDDPDLRQQRERLVTINGVAERTATRLMAELGDITRFDDIRDVVAFAGLNPALRQSGKWNGHVRISKVGSSVMRAALYMPAVSATRCNPVIRALAERLKARGKPGKVIIVAAMRKLLHIAYGVLKSGRDFDASVALRSVS